jgi:glycine hydroxymethyltransferase
MNYRSRLNAVWKAEEKRQRETITFIPSENFTSRRVREALGSVFSNKYAEGYPGKRYYPGNAHIDEVENACRELILKVFRLSPKKWAANVQPYSGSPANLAIYIALMRPGDTLMGMKLSAGGHLTHGHFISASGIFYHAVQYGLGKNDRLDYSAIEKLARKERPKVIVVGHSAYPRAVDFRRFAKIARSVGAYLVADVAHIAGLIATGVHPNCFPHADVVVFTTHKNFHGPRGAVIISRAELAEKIDKGVFPGVQGGPHENQILAKALAFEEATRPAFRSYQKQVIKNTRTLADALKKQGFTLLTGGTDNHLLLIDLAASGLDASVSEKALESIGIVANRNSLPRDDKPFRPSGIRMGTHSATARDMREREMRQVARIVADLLFERTSKAALKKEVRALARKFIYRG